MMATEYSAFLASKARRAPAIGFSVAEGDINPMLFGFQRTIVRWAIERGRASIWADCGLGKTPMQLEWARLVCEQTGGSVLILAPLAVAEQTVREGQKFGVQVTLCRTQADIQPGINITNYEMLKHFTPAAFVGVVCDESSILKSYTGKIKNALVESFAATPYKLCCTATPAPNDHMEIGNHCEFLGVMPSSEMLTRWFINDTSETGTYRLKGHAVNDFWDWVASWAVSLRKPSDIGFSDDGFILPELHIHHEIVEVDLTTNRGDQLFRAPTINATTMHKEKRLTAATRAERVAEIVNGSDEVWAVWCDTNYEADELKARIPDAIEVRGSDKPSEKTRKLTAFSTGEARVIIIKPEIGGYGLNWQHCHKTIYIGLSYSFEDFYQTIRRFYRFGQQSSVDAVIVAAETEGQVLATVQRKLAAYEEMSAAMNASTRKLALASDLTLAKYQPTTHMQLPEWLSGPLKEPMTVLGQHIDDQYALYHGDCVDVARALPGASVHLSIFSPPFSNLYIYSDSERDCGNSATDDEFFQHFDYLIPELLRITIPGRLCAVHCKQLPNYKGRDGMAGLRDFRGEIIRHFIAAGWAYHSEVCIWKDPVIEMQRTKAHGLLYKQLRADSSFSRQGMAEYLLVFRRWPQGDAEETAVQPVTHTKDDFPLDMWQRYASPVWFDIQQTRVLNAEVARESQDEKHICPLQLQVIERALDLWTNPGDVVFDPFNGIGSSGVISLEKGRRYIGSELKEAYVRQAVRFLNKAVAKKKQPTLWDALPTTPNEATNDWYCGECHNWVPADAVVDGDDGKECPECGWLVEPPETVKEAA